MKTLCRALLICFLGNQCSMAAADAANEKELEKEIIKIVDAFMDDPAGEEADAHAASIVVFAIESSKVTVTIRTAYAPWIGDEKEDDNTKHLLAAYIAGNVREQLLRGVKKDCPFEGVTAMLTVYRKLRADDKVRKIPTLEKWAALGRQGSQTRNRQDRVEKGRREGSHLTTSGCSAKPAASAVPLARNSNDSAVLFRRRQLIGPDVRFCVAALPIDVGFDGKTCRAGVRDASEDALQMQIPGRGVDESIVEVRSRDVGNRPHATCGFDAHRRAAEQVVGNRSNRRFHAPAG
jgi:hypothetical protein